jgi:predicted ArsR family transcriptional regulator
MVDSFRFPEDMAGLRNVRSRIIGYLASNGASKVSDISSAVGSSRDNVRYHLSALEAASLVRSNISPGTRTGCTPFYALAPVTSASRERVH